MTDAGEADVSYAEGGEEGTLEEEHEGGEGGEGEEEDAELAAEIEALNKMIEHSAEANKELSTAHKDATSEVVAKQKGGVAANAAALERDAKSIYVGNVDFSTTADELRKFFESCGSIEAATILMDKFTGKPKGFAYIEFCDKESVQTALVLDGSMFKDRPLKVIIKRTNVPAFQLRGRGGRGRGVPRGRGRGGAPGFSPRGGYRGGAPYRGGYNPRGRGGRGRGFAPF